MRAMIMIGFFATTAMAADPPTRPSIVLDPGGHTGRVWKVGFTPDSAQLVSVSFDKTVRVWDVASGQSIRSIHLPTGPGEAGMMIALAIHPKGDRAAVAGVGPDVRLSAHPVYIVSLSSGRVEKVLSGPTGVVNFLAYSADGEQLVAGSHDKSGYVWDADGRLTHVLRGHTGMIEAVAFGPKRRVMTTAHDKTVRVWADGKVKATWVAHNGPISAAAWSPDGTTIATGGQNGTVKLWRPDGEQVRELDRVTASNVTALAFTPDSRELLFTGLANERPGGRVKGFITVATGVIDREARTANMSLTDGAVSPNGNLVAVATIQADVVLQNVSDGAVVRRLTAGGSNCLYAVGWLPDGRGVGWGTEYAANNTDRAELLLDGGLDLAAMERVAKPGADVTRPQLTRNGRTLVWNTAENRLELRANGKLEHVLQPTLADAVSGSLEVVSFGWWGDDRIAVGGNAVVFVFDPATGKQTRRLVGHTDVVMSVAASADGRYLASVSNDRTVRVWTTDRHEPLLGLFPSGDDWLAWTPEGYYAASPGGERLLAWRVDNGPSSALTIHPAAQFRASLYRPDVIKLLLKEGSVEKALAVANAALPKPKATVASVAEVLPPVVLITSPDAAKFESKDATLDLKFVAKAVGKQPITGVRLLINGRPYPDTEHAKTFDAPRTGDVRETWTVKLSPGTHTYAVVAETAASKGVSEGVEVAFGARGMLRDPEDAKRAEELQKPAMYVLAIGVSAYTDEKLKLNFAAKDAEAIAKAVEAGGKGIYRKVEAKVLTDKDATRKNILQGLTWMRKQMTQNDVGVISFAGHGEKDADGTFYLLPVDVDMTDLLSSSVPGDQIKKTLAGMPGKFVVLLDACHSGGIDGEKRRAAGSLTDDLVRDLATDEYGVVVLCSSTGREFSLESAKVGHGYFTLALIEGLNGKGPKTTDGAVYLHHLDSYVTDRVKELSEGRQHPVTSKPSSLRSFPLAKP